MARRKNVKRIDPRYFLNETVNRNDDGSRLEEDLDEAQLSEEEEIEEGFKDFVQGTKDTFRDITKGRKLGKTRQIRKDAEEARRLDAEEEAARPAREKARKDRAAAEKRERIRAADAAMSRAADRMRRGSTSKDDEDLEYRRDRMDPDRHARRERERERRHSGFGSDHYVEQE